jgi:magnesium transporter
MDQASEHTDGREDRPGLPGHQQMELGLDHGGQYGPDESRGPTQAEQQELVVHENGVEEASEQRVEALLESLDTPEALAPRLEEMSPADAALTLESLEPGQTAQVLGQVEEESAADALAHMDPALAATVLLDLEADEASSFVDLMDPDDAADVLQALPKPVAESLLRRLKPRKAAVLGKLALYDPRSAGGVMTTQILVVRGTMTIGQAIEFIRTHPMEESQSDVYVVDENRRLIGTVSLRTLLFAPDEDSVLSHVERGLDAVLPTVDREEVANLFQKYDYITMPVVDEERRILGMVTIDDVLDIVRSQRAEDPLKLVGVREGEGVSAPVSRKVMGRFPWLLTNLLTAQAASAVLLYYHEFIELLPIVAVIYPVIANESGNTGQQSLAVVLRGMVLGQVRRENVAKLLGKELAVGVIAGLMVGFFFCMTIWGIQSLGVIPELNWRLGVVAGLATMGAMSAACIVGAGIPLLLDRLGFDPATASSIFLTMLTDSLSYGIFLTLAFFMRGWLGV